MSKKEYFFPAVKREAWDTGDLMKLEQCREREIKRFPDATREELIKKGYSIYELKGGSIKTAKAMGLEFWSDLKDSYPDLESLQSMRSEVAIDPKQFIMPGSRYKTLLEQEALVEKFSRGLSEKVKGARGVIGTVADYAELTLLRLDELTAEEGSGSLFGGEYRYNYIITKTKAPNSEHSVVAVGGFRLNKGLGVKIFTENDDGKVVGYIAPMIVPE